MSKEERTPKRALSMPPWFVYDHGNRDGAIRIDKILAFDTDSDWVDVAGRGRWVISLRLIFEGRSEPEIIQLTEEEYNRFRLEADHMIDWLDKI